MNQTSIPELLAPAGSWDALVAAIAAGADAVYLGGSRFGARHFASNFSDDEICRAISYSHLRRVRVYLTVNTLILERELPEAIAYLLFLYQAGVDAVLVQDIGLLRIIHDCIPGLTVHASTQMTVHNREGASFVASRGCSRIVLARELETREIRDIAEALGETGGIEVFGHGALCYAYSGQCLLSSVIGGRSGNRGMCAQPCRKRYDLMTGGPNEYGFVKDGATVPLPSRYLLSTRDLCLYPVLDTICTLSVESLKIEGRMRSPAYVATVVSIYRRALDAIRSGTFTPDPHETESLMLAFSRGFTTGYISGNSFLDLMGREKPGKQGILIGTVERSVRGSLVVHRSSDTIPAAGDGLVCIGNGREEGFVIHADPVITRDQIHLSAGISGHSGDRVYLTSRAADTRWFESLMQNPDQRFLASIPLDLNLEITKDGVITASCSSGPLSLSYTSAIRFEPAKTRPVTIEQIKMSLQKTKGTLFAFRSITIQYDESGFAPVRVLNEIRRELLDRVSTEICRRYQPDEKEAQKAAERIHLPVSRRNPPKRDLSIGVIVSDPESVHEAFFVGADYVWLEWGLGMASIREMATAYEHFGIKVPRIMRRKDLDAFYAFVSDNAGIIRHWMVDTLGIGEMIQQHSTGTLSGYYGLNVTNHASLYAFPGYEFITLSPELSGDQIRDIGERVGADAPELAVMVQGCIEAMITEDQISSHSRHYAIRDEKGVTFPVIGDSFRRTHILNGMETSLLEYIPDLFDAGVSWLIIDARWRTAQYSRDVVGIYRSAVGLLKGGRYDPGELKEELRRCAYGGVTAGTYKRGV